MNSIVDLSASATTIAVIFTVTVAAILTVVAVLAPRAEARARAERLLVLLFSLRPRGR